MTDSEASDSSTSSESEEEIDDFFDDMSEDETCYQLPVDIEEEDYEINMNRTYATDITHPIEEEVLNLENTYTMDRTILC